MRLLTPRGRDLWLAYCMNVHPGGTLASTVDAVRETVLPLRERLGHRGPFGVGLRFDGPTVEALAGESDLRAELGDVLGEHDLVPFTANGFVLGAFHGRPLKDEVYRPAWTDPGRVRYTVDLARVLADLRPDLEEISISTAPGSWRGWGEAEESPRAERAAAENLVRVARRLAELHEETGALVRLGLEPEPGCTIDTVDDAVAFFHGPLARALGEDRDGVREHLGVCYDVCHQAVMHEEPEEGLAWLADSGVPVVKMQASSALEVARPDAPASRDALAAFAEPVYLHQVAARDADGRLHVADDLPTALEEETWASRRPWRIHFHVPVFREEAVPPLHTTRAVLDRALAVVARGDVTRHLEIETYTWDVLPPGERRAGSGFDLVEALAREYEHVLDVLSTHGVVPDAPGRPEST